MRIFLSLSFLIVVGFAASGCGAGKTPEEVEAAKYPKPPPLTAEEQAKAKELASSTPSPNGSK